MRIYIKCRNFFWLSLQTWHLKTLNGLSILLTSFFLIFKLPVLPLLWSYIDEEMLWHQFWISSVRPYKLTFYALLSHMCIYIPEGATCFCHFIRFPFSYLFLWMYAHIFFEKYGFKVMFIWNYERNFLVNLWRMGHVWRSIKWINIMNISVVWKTFYEYS